MSFAPEVKVDGEWVGNALRFATRNEALRNVRDLQSRWFLVTDVRVVVSDDPVNYRWTDRGLVRVEGAASNPAVPFLRELVARGVDVVITDQGSIWVVTPITARAVRWIEKNVDIEDYMRVAGTSFAADWRQGRIIEEAMFEAGFGVVVRTGK